MEENPIDEKATVIASRSDIQAALNESPVDEQPVTEVPVKENPKKKSWAWWIVGGCAILAVCLCIIPVCVIAVLALLGPSVGKTFSGITSTIEAPLSGSVQKDANAIGNPDAKVVIIEYSDFQCPYCKKFAEDTGKQIIKNYAEPGRIYFVYRSMGNFISDFVGGNTESQDAAQAAYCAGDQGKFWEYHDALFANWSGENQGNFSVDRLNSFAQDLGLKSSEFLDCLTSQKYLSRVMQDAADGAAKGVRATPSFLINGEVVEGALPYADFEKIITDALAK
jgi:protein-disulfide isomerase